MDRRIVVNRAVPTDPSVRSSESLFLTETENQVGAAQRELLAVDTIDPPVHLAELIGPGEVIVRRRLMSVDGVPVRISNSYFSASTPEAESLAGEEFIAGGLQQLFENHGRRFGNAQETLVARPATSQEAELLELGPGAPVVQIVRASFDDAGNMIHTLESICAADKHVFVVTQAPGDEVF
jgi:DNA-binding GntR family transcriptional regulator